MATAPGCSSVGPSADGRIKPDVAAQGDEVYTAGSGSPSSYQYVAGTSFACPLVAGAAALVLQAHPDDSVDQVIEALRATASQPGAPDNLLGWGIVNAFAAVGAQGSGTTRPHRRATARTPGAGHS